MDANEKRQLTYLYENRHKHDDDPDFQQQITIINNTLGTVVDSGAGSGAHIHLTRAATQEIDGTGELIEWDTAYTVIPRFEFHPGLSDELPLTEATIPMVGYYNVPVQLGWDTFEGGGTVEIRRNPSGENELVWPPPDDPGLWSVDVGDRFEGVAPAIPFRAGDTVGVWLSPDDASAQTLESATVGVYLVDRVPTRSVFYVDVVLADGPAGYWRLDEGSGTTAADSSGNGHDGTYIGTPTLSEPGVMDDGSGSTSVELNGSSQWVTVPEASVEGLTDITVEAWINVDAATRYGIFNVNDAGAADSGRNRWGFWVTAAGNLEYSDDASNNTTSTGTIQVGERQHVAFTRTAAGDLVFYINGAAAGTGTVATTTAEAGDTVQIGMDIDSTGNTDQFNGHVDEVAVYPRVLAAGEIAHHATVGGL